MSSLERNTEEIIAGGRDRVYKAERLRSVAMPLGGIGTGNLALAGDGSLRQWQIFNTANHLAMVPDSFFSIWARKGDGKPVAKVLQSAELYHKDYDTVPSVNDYVVPEAAKKLLSELPGIKETEFIGEYPIAEVIYKDPSLPVEVSLEAFSPFIPLNAADSGIPAVIFTFKLRNPSNQTVSASVAMTLQNAVGYNGVDEITDVHSKGYGGNKNTATISDGLTMVSMHSIILPEKCPTNGTMTLAALSSETTCLAAWDDLKAFWADFSEDGRVRMVTESELSKIGTTWNAAIAVPVELAPDEEKSVTFIMSWHFPNRYVDWNQQSLGIEDKKSLFWIGNAYGARFSNSDEVIRYVVEHFDRLDGETRLFRKTFYDSTLPYWFLDCVSSQISTLRSPTCLWNEDGKFHAFEGCHGASTWEWKRLGGCCPLDCTHVWNYEMTLSRLFPDLERSMRDTDLVAQLLEDGEVPHRTVLPEYLPRWKEGVAADGQCGTILKVYREYLQSGDVEFLSRLWPRVERAMSYAIVRWDSDDDGVMDGAQWNTYDCNVYGHNSFITGMFLAALRASEEMALILGEPELAKHYHDRYEKGRRNLDEETFDGDYYIQIYDEKKYTKTQYGRGCLSDQLIGQWWAHILGLGYILPQEHVRSALKNIFINNFMPDFVDFQQQRIYASPYDRGLLNCTWPKGGRPEGKAIDYADEVWTGVEYEVAGLMIREGLIDEGLQIIKAARDRYDGFDRNPWNEVECGDHYVRPMSSWYLLESISGWHYDAAKAAIDVAPQLYRDGFRSFFVTTDGWGSYSELRIQQKQSEILYVAWGELVIGSFRFAWVGDNAPGKIEVLAAGNSVEFNWSFENGCIRLSFPGELTISKGQSLVVRAE